MQIREVSEDLALIVPMLILLEGVVAVVLWFAWGSKGGRGARIAAWLGLVTLTLWCGSAAAFVLLNLIYFNFGSQVTIAAAVLVTVFMIAMPFGWAYVVRHHGRDDTGPQTR
jgi:maltodextrin utilization protein YvdJ